MVYQIIVVNADGAIIQRITSEEHDELQTLLSNWKYLRRTVEGPRSLFGLDYVESVFRID